MLLTCTIICFFLGTVIVASVLGWHRRHLKALNHRTSSDHPRNDRARHEDLTSPHPIQIGLLELPKSTHLPRYKNLFQTPHRRPPTLHSPRPESDVNATPAASRYEPTRIKSTYHQLGAPRLTPTPNQPPPDPHPRVAEGVLELPHLPASSCNSSIPDGIFEEPNPHHPPHRKRENSLHASNLRHRSSDRLANPADEQKHVEHKMSKKIPRQKKRRKRESYNERPRTSDLDEDLPKKKYSVEPPREPSPPVSKKRHLEKPAHPTDVPLKKTATSSSSHQPPPSPRDNPPATQTPGPSPLPDDHPPAKKTPPSSKALDLERSQQQSLLKSARDPNPPQGRAPLSAKSTSAQLSFNKFHAAPGDYELEEDRYIDILFKHAEIQKEGKKPNAKHITPLTKDPTKPECTTNSATLEPILPTSIPPSKNNDQTPFTLNSPNPSGRVTENPSPLLLSRPNNAEPWKLDAHEPPIANSTVVNPFKQPPASTLNSTAFSAPTDSANRLEVPFGHRDSVQFPKLPNFSHNPLLPSPQPPNPTSSIAVQPPSNSQFNIRLDGTPVQSPFGITANTNSGHLKLNAPS